MSNKIAAGICFYNDCKSLERTLQSLDDKVDYLVCVDGRYKNYKDNSPSGLSTDGSRDLVNSYDKSTLLDMPDVYEVQKRQGYLDWCARWRKTFDIYPNYLLIIDSDEYVAQFDDTVFKAELEAINNSQYAQYNVFAVMLEVQSGKYHHVVHKFTGAQKPQTTASSNRRYDNSPRLWLRPWEMEYNLRHYHYRKRDPTSSLHYQEQNAAVKIVKGIKINHDHVLRTKEHLEGREKYQKWLVPFEQKKINAFHKRTGLLPLVDEFDKVDIE